MPENPSAAAENGQHMTTVTPEAVADEMSTIVRQASEPIGAGETVGALIRRASRRLQINYGRCKRLWYREILQIPAHEADNLRARHRALKRARLNALERTYEDLRADLIADPLLGRLAPPALRTGPKTSAPEASATKADGGE